MERQPTDAKQNGNGHGNTKPAVLKFLGTAEEYRVWFEYIACRTPALRDAIFGKYEYLIGSMAKKAIRRLPYRPLVEAGDVYNDATVGFLEALENYDPMLCAFTTHAYSRVKGAIVDGLRHLQDVPRIVSQIRRETAPLKEQLWHESGVEPTTQMIVERFPDFKIGGYFGTPLINLYGLYGNLIETSIFNQLPENQGAHKPGQREDIVSPIEQALIKYKPQQPRPQDKLQRQFLEAKIIRFLSPSPDEQIVIFQYFFVGLTDSDIAKGMRPKRSTTWVSTVKESGLRKLRKAFRQDEVFADDIKANG